MIRSTIKKMVLRWSINSITESFEDYVRKNPDCRLCDVSAAVLPGDLGKRSRLFASHIMDDLVKSDRVIKYNRIGSRYPQFVVQ
jgi:hypothetical protein